MTADIFSGAIDVMLLLVPFLVAVLWVKWFGEFLNAAAKKQKRRAAAFAFPIFAPALLIIGYSVYASYFPNDSESRKVFFSVFKTQPTAQIYNLKGQDLSREEEQSEPTFLSFQAPPATIAHLTNKKFTLLLPKQRSLCAIENWETPPPWFSTTITPQTEIYHFGDKPSGGNYFLFYEPREQTARVFFGTDKSETAPY